MISRRHSQKVDDPNENRCDEEAMQAYPKVIPMRIIATTDNLCMTAEDILDESYRRAVLSLRRLPATECLRRYRSGAQEANGSQKRGSLDVRAHICHAEPRRTKARHGRPDQLVQRPHKSERNTVRLSTPKLSCERSNNAGAQRPPSTARSSTAALRSARARLRPAGGPAPAVVWRRCVIARAPTPEWPSGGSCSSMGHRDN
jgi:hypothetical protein